MSTPPWITSTALVGALLGTFAAGLRQDAPARTPQEPPAASADTDPTPRASDPARAAQGSTGGPRDIRAELLDHLDNLERAQVFQHGNGCDGRSLTYVDGELAAIRLLVEPNPPVVVPPPVVPPPVVPPPVTPPPVIPPPPTLAWPALTSVSGPHTFGISLDGKLAGQTKFVGVDFQATGQGNGSMNGGVIGSFSKLHQDYIWEDCAIRGVHGPNGQDSMRWGVRAFDMVNTRFERVDVGPIHWEHGLYLAAPGPLTLIDCRFHDIPGAAVQIAYRYNAKYPNETTDPNLGQLTGTHLYKRCTFDRIGDPNSERFGAFVISEHEAQVNGFTGGKIPLGDYRPFLEVAVVIEDCSFKGDNFVWVDPNGVTRRSTHAIMVHNRRRVEIRDTVIDMPAGIDNWQAQLWDITDNDPSTIDVILDNVTVIGGGTLEIRNASVQMTNCKGDGRILVGTGAPYKWPIPNKVYEGPVTQDYTYNN